MTAILRIRDVHKRFEDGVSVLRGVDLDVASGEIACLLGPSGCGKTTLLRIVAGLESPDRGEVRFAGQDMLTVPVHQRGFGLMFQDYALFPHKDVAANVAFGLQMQGLAAPQVEERVREMLALVDLQEMARRDVSQLSGGEQQRVALARALAPAPRLLMLDEPIGALDRTLRDRLLAQLRQTLKQVGVTVLYVTHDQSEAFAIADRVILMRQGQVIQSGAPHEVYRRPGSLWVARFLGMENLLPGEWVSPGLVRTEVGTLSVVGCGEGSLTVLIRPEAARLADAATASTIAGVVRSSSFRGALTHVVIECPSGRALTFELPTIGSLPQSGDRLALTLQPDGIVCLEN